MPVVRGWCDAPSNKHFSASESHGGGGTPPRVLLTFRRDLPSAMRLWNGGIRHCHCCGSAREGCHRLPNSDRSSSFSSSCNRDVTLDRRRYRRLCFTSATWCCPSCSSGCWCRDFPRWTACAALLPGSASASRCAYMDACIRPTGRLPAGRSSLCARRCHLRQPLLFDVCQVDPTQDLRRTLTFIFTVCSLYLTSSLKRFCLSCWGFLSARPVQ